MRDSLKVFVLNAAFLLSHELVFRVHKHIGSFVVNTTRDFEKIFAPPVHSRNKLDAVDGARLL